MQKLLILGAKGNLGTELTKFLSTDYETIAWDKEDVDVLDKGLISKKIQSIKPAIIINTASYNAVDKCEEDVNEFLLAKRLNAEAAGAIAKAALKNKSLIVHYSSDYVFPGNDPEGYQEDAKPKPLNNYGISKFKGEQELVKLTGKGLKWYLIRTSKLFGPKGLSEAAKPSFFDIMLKLGREKEELKVVDEEVSCFTYTVDLALETKKLVESGKGYGIYHIANSGPSTWYQAAKELFSIAGNATVRIVPVASEEFPRPAKRPKYSILLNTKLEPMRDYREALKDYLNN